MVMAINVPEPYYMAVIYMAVVTSFDMDHESYIIYMQLYTAILYNLVQYGYGRIGTGYS